MAFFTMADFATKVIRTRNTDPATNPEPIQKGTLVLSSDLSAISVCTVAGHLGGDNFEVQYTAGSNLVIIPNNVLVWSGLKLFSPQFPAGVAITGKTANFREFTIASNATTTRKEKSNFCYLRTARLTEFGDYNARLTPSTDMNNLTFEGSYYMPSTSTNIPISGSGFFVEVMQSGSSIVQILYANRTQQNVYTRRSTDAGATWSAYIESISNYTSWQTLSLSNSYAHDTNPLQYSVNGNLLYLRGGVLTPAGAVGTTQTIATIPTNGRPFQKLYGNAFGSGTGATTRTFNRIEINTNGTIVNSFSGTIQGLQLDGVYVLG